MTNERINNTNAKSAVKIVQQQSVHLRCFYSTGKFLNVNTFCKYKGDCGFILCYYFESWKRCFISLCIKFIEFYLWLYILKSITNTILNSISNLIKVEKGENLFFIQFPWTYAQSNKVNWHWIQNKKNSYLT